MTSKVLQVDNFYIIEAVKIAVKIVVETQKLGKIIRVVLLRRKGTFISGKTFRISSKGSLCALISCHGTDLSRTVSYCLALFPTVGRPTTSALVAGPTICVRYPFSPSSPPYTIIQLFNLPTLWHCNSLWYLQLRPVAIFSLLSLVSLFSQPLPLSSQ